jgi:hypothetical protein
MRSVLFGNVINLSRRNFVVPISRISAVSIDGSSVIIYVKSIRSSRSLRLVSDFEDDNCALYHHTRFISELERDDGTSDKVSIYEPFKFTA